MFKLLTKILSATSSRLLNVVGLPGVGKSMLVKNTLSYIQERRLLQGCILSDAQNINDCEILVKQLVSQI
jgi:Ni2+-binding GTPase involved in maturation of urease and hydrogenase